MRLKQTFFLFFANRARWRDNRTIFNTPNPRLMNVSLLRDNKLLHGQERRGSRMSVRLPSRQPSMASLRPHSPNASIGKLGLYPQDTGEGAARNARACPSRTFSIPFVRVVVDVCCAHKWLMLTPPVDDLFSKLVTSSILFLHSSACCSRRVHTNRFSGSWLDADCSISGKLDGSTTCMQAG